MREENRAQRLDHDREKRPYFHMGDDPHPPQTGVNKVKFGEMVRAMRDYLTAMFSAYKRTKGVKD